MDAIPVERMNIAMLIRLVQMMLHIIQDQNTTIEALRRQVQDLVTQVYQMGSKLAQLRAGIGPGLDAGSEAVEEGPQNPDAILRSLEVTYQLPYIDIPTIRKTAQALDAKKVHELDLRGFHLKASARRTHQNVPLWATRIPLGYTQQDDALQNSFSEHRKAVSRKFLAASLGRRVLRSF
ncbi:hypothetical protein DER46DRAFT_657471 [Fusarium sp. MPI-SDFR-AT-0072]|nr:hypothetical protein DER46DRAFT_657471 [Fusarium sp. MPI-SDFR-AT-0072]